MRKMSISAVLFFVSMVVSATVWADPKPEVRCNVCTCANDEVVCLEQQLDMMEVLEEGLCGPACSGIGSSFEDIDVVDGSCFEVLACTALQRQAPAAGPLWLSAAALGMLVFGGMAVRRARASRV